MGAHRKVPGLAQDDDGAVTWPALALQSGHVRCKAGGLDRQPRWLSQHTVLWRGEQRLSRVQGGRAGCRSPDLYLEVFPLSLLPGGPLSASLLLTA